MDSLFDKIVSYLKFIYLIPEPETPAQIIFEDSHGNSLVVEKDKDDKTFVKNNFPSLKGVLYGFNDFRFTVRNGVGVLLFKGKELELSLVWKRLIRSGRGLVDMSTEKEWRKKFEEAT
jgi:hypothetical protein